MEIKLKLLKITNFMNLDHFVFEPDGKDALIFGDNGTFKTTTATAFSWLFTGKDIYNSEKFEVKNTTGPIPDGGIDHAVEAFLSVDGKPHTIERGYHETYGQNRDTANQVMTGHTTDYYINGGPRIGENEFLDQLQEIIPFNFKLFADQSKKAAYLKYFQLLSNPHFFIEHFGDDKKMRDFLFAIFGNQTDQEIINANPDLNELIAILDGKKYQDRQVILKNAATAIDKDLKSKGPAINENVRIKNQIAEEIKDLNLAQLKARREVSNVNLSGKQAELSRLQNGNEVTQQRLNLQQADLDIQKLEAKWKENLNQEAAEKEDKKTKLSAQSTEWQSEISAWNREISYNKNDISKKNLLVTSKTKDYLEAREKFTLKNLEEFVFDPAPYLEKSAGCPVCYRPIDQNAVDSIKEELKKQFNLKKSESAELIRTSAMKIKAEVDELKKEIDELKTASCDLETKIAGNNALIETQKAEIDRLQICINRIKNKQIDSSEYKLKVDQKAVISQKITELESSTKDAVEKINQEIANVQTLIQSINADIGKFDSITRADARIKELEVDETRLAGEYSKLQRQLNLIEKFIRAKCDMLSDQINKNFEFTRWELFRNQVNGGIEEICNPYFNGTPGSTGQKIIMGLDIIRAFSKALNVSLPVWIDDSNLVTRPIDTGSQQIRLVVSEPDEKLRIEYQK